MTNTKSAFMPLDAATCLARIREWGELAKACSPEGPQYPPTMEQHHLDALVGGIILNPRYAGKRDSYGRELVSFDLTPPSGEQTKGLETRSMFALHLAATRCAELLPVKRRKLDAATIYYERVRDAGHPRNRLMYSIGDLLTPWTRPLFNAPEALTLDERKPPDPKANYHLIIPEGFAVHGAVGRPRAILLVEAWKRSPEIAQLLTDIFDLHNVWHQGEVEGLTAG